ncbi:MAG: type II secretion system protein [Patescibacteria group bacterium]
MRKTKGFTLLELLVVIGIIAILVSIATVSYSSAQIRTRDSRRRADLSAMRDALEQYYAANTFVYPTTCSGASGYIKGTWPTDPGTYSYVQSCTAATYCICVQMETGSGGNSSNSICTWAAGGGYYCVANQQ